MTIEALLKFGKQELIGKAPNPLLDAEVLLAHVLHRQRTELFTHNEEVVETTAKKNFKELIQKRTTGVPVAYLTGTKEFYGLKFYVDPRVLVPRPESELIVESVIAHAAANPEAKTLLDVGTGSGAIAIASALYAPKLSVTACDISTDALVVAKKNAKTLGADVKFIISDLLQNIQGSFDIITANLPYIGTETNAFVEPEVVAHEPNVALFGGKDGLDLYRRLLSAIAVWQKKPSLIALEITPKQKTDLIKTISNLFPQTKLEVKKDLAGHDRVILITKNL